ncbi:bifunctional UDP-N-acetylglucosamine diphosphorylase/glucosamine-1-phosphate N-acetyltransferase GlmU [Alphaproteobacteria bacterium]|nr:bifunctional UDP-N-acetylglucosamine diphosphorylase/glucosamine-1-phosphate N-acetyltransferase GlmU [Alphaproteobacteria bacterium]
MKKITTVILAAGKSTRFKHKKSKIFQDLAGIEIINHVYQVAKKTSNKEVVFVCNKENIIEIKNKFPYAKCVLQKNQKGTADAIVCAKKYIKNKNVLILFGDVPLLSSTTITKLYNNYVKNDSIGSMIAFKTNNPYGYGRVKAIDNKVLSVVEEINTTLAEKKILLCNSGVMLCNAKLLFSNINKISNKNLKKEKYLPDIFQIFNNLEKSFSYIICPREETLGINTIDDLILVDKILQKKLKANIIKNGVILQQPETIRLCIDTKIKKGSIIEPFVTFKPRVLINKNVLIKSYSVIEECSIGENSSIGPSARIRPKSKIGKSTKIGNFVEVKNSVIGNKNSISHLSYIGDSHLGNNVNIGAGTITCNYDGKKKNKTIIKDQVFVGSNCSLVAPITIGRKATIGAGSVVTRNIPDNYLALERSDLKILRKQRKK